MDIIDSRTSRSQPHIFPCNVPCSARRHQYPKDLAWMLTPVKQLCLAQRKESFLARNTAPVKLAMALTEDLPQACVQSLFAAWSAFGEGGGRWLGISWGFSDKKHIRLAQNLGFPWFPLLPVKTSRQLSETIQSSRVGGVTQFVSKVAYCFTNGSLFHCWIIYLIQIYMQVYNTIYVYIYMCMYVCMCV